VATLASIALLLQSVLSLLTLAQSNPTISESTRQSILVFSQNAISQASFALKNQHTAVQSVESTSPRTETSSSSSQSSNATVPQSTQTIQPVSAVSSPTPTPSPSSVGAPPVAQNPLIVTDASHLVVMQYEAWFGPNWGMVPNLGTVHPLLSSSDMNGTGYDSADPAVMERHLQWLNDLGVDAVMLDFSNGVWCQFALHPCSNFPLPGVLPSVVASNIQKIYATWGQSQSPRIIPMLGAFEAGDLTVDSGDNKTPLEREVDFFAALMNQYPRTKVIYQGKPLMAIYMTPDAYRYQSTVLQQLHTRGLDQRFTFRIVSGLRDQEPGQTSGGQISKLPAMFAGLSQDAMPSPLWTWVDRLNGPPTYTLSPDFKRVEAFTASIVTPGTGDMTRWYGSANAYNPTASLFNNGATFKKFIDYAKLLSPTFLIIHQFNEFATDAAYQDDGFDAQTLTDIEPTREYGDTNLKIVGTALQDYRTQIAQTVPLYRFNKGADYLPTLALSEGFSAGYIQGGVVVRLYRNGGPGFVGLYRCVIGVTHFTSTDSGCEGQKFEVQLGFLSSQPGANLRPLYRVANQNGSYLTTPDSTEGAGQGFAVTGILGYIPVDPQAASSK
jgi:hypothetical protein